MRGTVVDDVDRILMSSEKIKILADIGNPTYKQLEKVTELANLPGTPFENANNRFKYQRALFKVCEPLVDLSLKEGIEGALALLLERGALLIGSFYKYPENQVVRVVSKRLDMADGTFGVGMSDLRLPEDITRFKRLHIQEDCIAQEIRLEGSCMLYH